MVYVCCSSRSVRSFVMVHAFIRLVRYLIAEFLCSCGSYESLCIILSVHMGFYEYVKHSRLCKFVIVTSR
jgi:hypothetical protein